MLTSLRMDPKNTGTPPLFLAGGFWLVDRWRMQNLVQDQARTLVSENVWHQISDQILTQTLTVRSQTEQKMEWVLQNTIRREIRMRIWSETNRNMGK